MIPSCAGGDKRRDGRQRRPRTYSLTDLYEAAPERLLKGLPCSAWLLSAVLFFHAAPFVICYPLSVLTGSLKYPR